MIIERSSPVGIGPPRRAPRPVSAGQPCPVNWLDVFRRPLDGWRPGFEIGKPVLILLTNDDGIYAPGLAAMERELERLGDVYVVAPATEQSGVGHSITYLSPLVVKELFEGHQRAAGPSREARPIASRSAFSNSVRGCPTWWSAASTAG